jgi:hypothetical protein
MYVYYMQKDQNPLTTRLRLTYQLQSERYLEGILIKVDL